MLEFKARPGDGTMADFVTLTCPTCGGKLQITPDIDRFACAHCGNEHLVMRAEGAIAIRPLTESLTGLRRATDRAASELAIRRLTDELAQLHSARRQIEDRAGHFRQQIASARSKRLRCLGALLVLVMTPLCLLVFAAFGYISQVDPEGSLPSRSSIPVFLAVGFLGFLAFGFFVNWLLSSLPTPARKAAEEGLRAAGAEIASLTERIAQKQAEMGRYQQQVGLGG
jgi:predicted RNA-binding Zn-ribbon protein involved in translation (DUF1610 family)